MNIYFGKANCPECGPAARAVAMANTNLPPGKKIIFVDVFSNDPRLSFLSSYYGSDQHTDWIIPLLLLRKPTMKKMFGALVESCGESIVIHPDYPEEFLCKLIKRIVGG